MGLRVILEYRCDFCEQTSQVVSRRDHDHLAPALLDVERNYPSTWSRRGDEFVCPLHRVVVRDLQAQGNRDAD